MKPASHKCRTTIILSLTCICGRCDRCGIYVVVATISPSPLPSPLFCLMGDYQQLFRGLEKVNTLATIPVHKTGFDVDDDHEESAMTESIYFF